MPNAQTQTVSPTQETENDVEQTSCSICDTLVLNDDLRFAEDTALCEDCYYEEASSCASCGDTYYRENMNYCDICEEDLCRYCDQDHHHEDHDQEYDNDGRNAFRNIDTKEKKFIDDKQGTTITSLRPFGIEIELLLPDYSTACDVSETLDPSHGLAPDGSLSGNGYAIEIQSTILSGKKGETEVKNICALLNNKHGKVNRSCGYHLHLDSADYFEKAPLIKKLWLFYSVFDAVILATLPPTRRKNTYCTPVSKIYGYNDINLAYSTQALEQIWYKEKSNKKIAGRKKFKDSTRYCGFNLHSLLANKHLEIRYHSATLNAVKMLNWVALHQAIMDNIKSNLITSNDIHDTESLLSIESKIEKFFSLLELPTTLEKYFKRRIKKFNASENILSDKPKKELCAV